MPTKDELSLKWLEFSQPEWWAERQRRIEQLATYHEEQLTRLTKKGKKIDCPCHCGHMRSGHVAWAGHCKDQDCNCRHFLKSHTPMSNVALKLGRKI